MIQLVAFLGNYGNEYAKTRHNVAWQFEESLPFANKLSWQSKFKGEIASCTPAELAQWACDYKIASKKRWFANFSSRRFSCSYLFFKATNLYEFEWRKYNSSCKFL